MKKNVCVILTAGVLFLGLFLFTPSMWAAEQSNALPVSSTVSSTVSVYNKLDYDTAKGEILAITSLQGIVNRTLPLLMKPMYGLIMNTFNNKVKMY